jgi:hypothetical protein
MPELSTELKTLRARIAAYESWGQTPDRTARTAKARKAFDEKFLTEADGDPQRAEALRRAYFARMAYKSAQVRARRVAELSGGGSDAA